jgi:phosphotransacetylase
MKELSNYLKHSSQIHLSLNCNTYLASFHSHSINTDNLVDGAKSNDVKMMTYILQRISPDTKERMLKMKNMIEYHT